MTSSTDLIFSKLYKKKSLDTITDIISFYEKNHYGIINFLYFANTTLNNIFENQKTQKEQNYFDALIQWDFLLPDGVALNLRAKIYQRKNKLLTTWLPNLNGTDFLPHFLKTLSQKQKIGLILYWANEETLKKTSLELKNQWYHIIHQQNGYEECDLWTISIPTDTIAVLLIARWSPLQEIRTYKNQHLIKEKKILAFTVWGLFDFIAKTEKRAPNRIRTIHWERLRRFMRNPSKNWKKFVASFSLFQVIIKKIILN